MTQREAEQEAPVTVLRRAEACETRELRGSVLEAEEPPVIDPEPLNELAELEEQGARGIVRRVVTVFLSDTPKTLGSIREAVDKKDSEAVRTMAHGLKSSCAAVGAKALSGMFKELEILGKAGSAEGAEPLITVAEQEFGRVKTALEARLECAS